MRRVITVNLGNNAFALDEDAYERLRAHITLAQSRLGQIADRAQIITNLERSIAERLIADRAQSNSTLVSDEQMQAVLSTIDPIEPSLTGTATSAADATAQRESVANYDRRYDTAEESDYTRLPVMLLCIFLGWLGVHRFFVGKIGTGLLMLVTLGALGIWTLVDFILIICGEFRDSSRRKIVRWT